jgi:hypothetical protein
MPKSPKYTKEQLSLERSIILFHRTKCISHPSYFLTQPREEESNGMMNATMGTGAGNSYIPKIVATPQLIKKSIGIKRRARVYPFFSFILL